MKDNTLRPNNDSGPDRDGLSRKNNTPESGCDERSPALTGFQRDLLQVLATDGVTSGRDAMRALEARYGDDVTRGRLYPNLDSLVQNGWIRKRAVDRRENAYLLTTRARKWLDSMATRYTEVVEEVRA